MGGRIWEIRRKCEVRKADDDWTNAGEVGSVVGHVRLGDLFSRCFANIIVRDQMERIAGQCNQMILWCLLCICSSRGGAMRHVFVAQPRSCDTGSLGLEITTDNAIGSFHEARLNILNDPMSKIKFIV